MISDLSLTERAGLPDALRVLVTELPRETWEAHPNFGGMVQFWLERHLMFRKLLSMLQDDARSALDQKMTFEAYTPRLSRFAGLFLNELHNHHHIEDSHYFPRLVSLDTRLERGFEILDSDHHAIDAFLNDMATAANDVLQSNDDKKIGPFETQLAKFQTLLNRHLTDEEEIIVPVILKTGFDG